MIEKVRERLRMYLRENTQQDVSKASGIPQTTISRFLREGSLGCEAFCKLVDLLGGSLLWIEEREPFLPSLGAGAGEEKLRARIAELEGELARERALREQAERFFGALASGRGAAAPVAEEKPKLTTTPQATRYSRREE